MFARPKQSDQAVDAGEERDKGLSTRWAIVIFGGVAVGILVSLGTGIGPGLFAGIATAAALNGLLR